MVQPHLVDNVLTQEFDAVLEACLISVIYLLPTYFFLVPLRTRILVGSLGGQITTSTRSYACPLPALNYNQPAVSNFDSLAGVCMPTGSCLMLFDMWGAGGKDPEILQRSSVGCTHVYCTAWQNLCTVRSADLCRTQ